MSPSARVRRHLQSHVVAYVALFVALSGSALALPGKNSVKSNDIKRGAVKGRAIAEGAVKRAKIRDAAVTAPKLSAAAVSGAALADSAVTTPKLADRAVTAAKLAQDSVTRQKVVQGAINGGKLANGAVDSAKVDNGSLLAEDFAPGQLSDGFALIPEPPSVSGSFTIQRAGRVFVTVTFVSDCTAGLCSHAVEIAGTEVPGTAVERPVGEEQLTLIGLTAPLPAGTHAIELTETGGTATESQITLAGVLLQ